VRVDVITKVVRKATGAGSKERRRGNHRRKPERNDIPEKKDAKEMRHDESYKERREIRGDRMTELRQTKRT